MNYSEIIERVEKLPFIWLPQWRWSEGFKVDRESVINRWSAVLTTSNDLTVEFDITARDDQKLIHVWLNVLRGFEGKGIGYFFAMQPFNPDGTPAAPYQRSAGDVIYERARYEAGDVESELLWNQFSAEWRPYFRRGCWLSGLPFESTSHEQLDWTLWFEQCKQDYALWTEEEDAIEREPSTSPQMERLVTKLRKR